MQSMKMFTIGEFASICGTTRDTLYHYDQIGVLKPEMTAQNGYRYYSPQQFFVYDTIAVLQEAGSSLSEIKHYIANQDSGRFLTMLAEKKEQLKQEQAKIKQMYQMLDNMETLIQSGMDADCEKVRFVECPAEYFIVADMRGLTVWEQDWLERIRDHFTYCAEKNLGTDFPMGVIFIKKHLLDGSYYEDYYCNRIYTPPDDPRLFIRPAGLYAVMEHRGNYESIPAAFDFIKEEIERNGMEITGCGYEDELLNYVVTGNPDEYVFRLSIEVDNRGEVEK